MPLRLTKTGVPRRKPGKRRELVVDDIDVMDGPKMAQLATDKHREFVWALYQTPPEFGHHTSAARLAGWGTPTSTQRTMTVIASKLMRDPKVLEAIYECDQKVYRGLGPPALRALSRMVEDPEHKDHCRAVGLVLGKLHPAETSHTLVVQHTQSMEATAQVLERILELANRAKVAPMIDAPMIDVTPAPEQPA